MKHHIGLPNHQGHTVLKAISPYVGEQMRELLKNHNLENSLDAEHIMRLIFLPPSN